MSIVGTAIVASGVIGAGASIYGATQAAGAQSQALGQATQTIRQGQIAATGTLEHTLGPYADVGNQTRQTLLSLLTPGPSQTATLSQLPGFQFARDLAGYGIAAGAGRRGISGTTAVEGGNLESALASQYFSNFVNPLQNLYSQGQGAAETIGRGVADIQIGASQNLANLAVGQGNVQAGLYGAIGGGVGNIGSSIANAALISKLTGGLNSSQPIPVQQPPVQYAGGPYQNAYNANS